MTLRQVGREARVERRVEVIGDAAVAGQHLSDEGLAVHDKPERLPHLVVVEGRYVDGHAQRQPAAARRLEHRQAGVRLHHIHLRERDVGHGVDLTAEQRVDLSRRVREVNDRDRVEVRLAAAPVVGVRCARFAARG